MLSRKPQKAVHSTDPGQSGLWLLLTFGGGLAGASIPHFATHSQAWTTGGGIIGAAVGAAAGATLQFRDWVSTRSRRRQIAESAGVATDITEQPLESLRVHSSDRDITEFVPRDIQHQLVEHLNNGTPVLIEGPSMSGKTRLAIETIRSHWPEVPCWFPRDDGDIEKLLSSNQQPAANTVILLDDLDRFLSNQTLTLGLLNQWTNNSCIIIATMMHSQYIKHSDRTNEEFSGWDTVNRFTRIALTPSLSANELNAVKLTSYARNLSRIESIGLGPLLGCAEVVCTAFADELEKHSWCGALIQAATDWRRIGLGPATKEQIETLATSYKAGKRSKHDRNKAWQQATNKIRHAVSILQQTESNRWEILDIIADNADWKIPEDTFAALQNIGISAQQARQSAITMALQGASPSSTNAMFQSAIAADPTNATTLGTYAIFLHTIRGDMDQAENMYQRAIAADPTDATCLGTYAIFLETVRGDMDQAEQMYQRAIAADPTDANSLGAYALLLHTIRGDMDQAENMYQRAITADPTDANSLGTYALFLHTVRGDTDRAQDMYQRAITADPTNARNLRTYALFLHTERGDTDQAQDMYQQAIEANPNDAIILGNYAQILFAKFDDKKAISLAEKAISLASNDEKPSLAECHFHLFAHSPKHRKDSGRALKTLLANGVTTGDWSFEMNLERVRREEDPRLELLEAVAQALRDGDMSRLDAFEEWRDL